MRSRLDAPVLLGVGAAFDFHAGLVPQAPRWIQSMGLEWAFRLSQEPRRLWRRAPERMTHWPQGTTLEKLHDGATRPGVSHRDRTGTAAGVLHPGRQPGP